MQKRKFTFLFLIATLLSYSTFAEAALQFLPRYQGGYGTRTQQGGKDKVCSSSYKYACSGSGYAGGVGTSCNDLYTSCNCSTNYKWSGGSCVLKSCSDYGYSASKDNTKSCEEKTPRSGLTCYVCTACDGSTYKYACSGGLNASTQGTTNKCGTNYSECSCVEHASWNSSSGKCECGSDYKAGTTSCTLKTCEDYGYSATEDTTKNCTKQTPRSGLACWNCSDCTGTLYDCSSMANASGGSGTACGGKYSKCKCKDLYTWDSGVCKLTCTRNSCSTTTYPLTAQNAANASSYEKCTPSCSDESPRYKVSSCASGYNVNSNGSGCDKNEAATCAAGEHMSVNVPTCHEIYYAGDYCGKEGVFLSSEAEVSNYGWPNYHCDHIGASYFCQNCGMILPDITNYVYGYDESKKLYCCCVGLSNESGCQYGTMYCDNGCGGARLCCSPKPEEPLCSPSVGYIYYKDNSCSAAYNSSKTAIGVIGAILNNGNTLMIVSAKEKSPIAWNNQYNLTGEYPSFISGLTSCTDKTCAENDSNGYDNTYLHILPYISYSGQPHDAAGYCKELSSATFGAASGIDWYLPAMGELKNLFDNWSIIKDGLSKISGADGLNGENYWSSTQYGSSSNGNGTAAWILTLDRFARDNTTWTQKYYSGVSAAHGITMTARCVLKVGVSDKWR